MELWIRSQNKQELTKAEHVGVYDNKVYINGYDEHGYRIAEYKSKERALEVLDEIQEKIKNGIGILNNKSYTEGSFRDHELVIDIPYTKIIVYEMPKE